MKIYNYDRITGAYIGPSTADPDPMNPGQFLLPACATDIEPPGEASIPLGHVAVFSRDRGLWVVNPVRAAAAEVIQESVAPTLMQRMAAMRAAVNAHGDVVAQGCGFDHLSDAVSYADEPAVPEFQAMGRALRAWRSLTWAAYEAIERDALSGAQPSPVSLEALMAMLPTFERPAPAVGVEPEALAVEQQPVEGDTA